MYETYKDFYGKHTIVCRIRSRAKVAAVAGAQTCVQKASKKSRCTRARAYHIEQVEREDGGDGRSASVGADKNTYEAGNGADSVGALASGPEHARGTRRQ